MTGAKVIIDTDAGIDDALAIFMALEAHKRGEVEVIAITTVHGNTPIHNVNVNVQRILHTLDMMEIPVYSGANTPLVHPYCNPVDPPYHGHDGFGDANLPALSPPPAPLQTQHAVLALLDLVKKYPGEVVLTTLGPLTNIALAQRLDPTFTSLLLGIYTMGGNTTGEGNISPCAEFNFACDSEAARVVLEEACIPIHLTHLEICLYTVPIPYHVRLELGQIKSKTAELMDKIEKKNLKQYEFESWITYDQLAVAWMIDDAKNGKLQKSKDCSKDNSSMKAEEDYLVTASKKCYATVELNGSLTRGQMVIDHALKFKRTPNVTIMSSVNFPWYMRYLKMAFGGQF